MHDARDRNAGIWIEASDRLYCAAYSSVASLVVRFSGYFRRANGDVTEYAVDVNPTSDRAITAGDVFFGSGFLLSCVAHLASGNANRGQCYARAQIQRGTGTAAVKLHTVVAGYVTDEYSPSFPYGKQEGPLEGQGNLRTFTGTNPAAGAEISEVVPTGARWHILNMRFALTTDANVANRYVGMLVDDGTTAFFYSPPVLAQTAGLSFAYVVSALGFASADTNVAINLSMPSTIILPAGYRFGTVTVGKQAGDDWAAPLTYIQEWLEG